MIKGGYRRKPGTEWSFVLSNKDIHDICGTKEISDFTSTSTGKIPSTSCTTTKCNINQKIAFQ